MEHLDNLQETLRLGMKMAFRFIGRPNMEVESSPGLAKDVLDTRPLSTWPSNDSLHHLRPSGPPN